MCFYREHMAITENIPQLLKVCLIIFCMKYVWVLWFFKSVRHIGLGHGIFMDDISR